METAVADTTPSAAPEAHPPSQEGTSSQPHQERQSLTHSERRAKLLQRLREGSSQGSEASPSAHPPNHRPGDASSAGAGSTEEASASQGAEATEVQPDKQDKRERERDPDIELKLARMSRELRDARADAIEAKQKVDAHDQLVNKLMRARQDPHALVAMLPDLFGRDFGQIADWIVENEQHFRERQRYAELPPDVREELEASRKERMERKEREEREGTERAQRERYESYASSARKYIEDNRADYPLAASTEWAADHIARAAIQRGTRDARPLLEEFEKNLRTELSGVLGKPELLRALLKSDAKLADAVRQAFFSGDGQNQKPNKSSAAASLRSGPTASADGPRALHNGVTASDVAGSYDARAARKARITEALKASLYGGGQRA